MTDFDLLIKTYDQMGMGYEIKAPEAHHVSDVHTVIYIEAQKHKHVKGYSNFFTEFLYDKTGKFIASGIWE